MGKATEVRSKVSVAQILADPHNWMLPTPSQDRRWGQSSFRQVLANTFHADQLVHTRAEIEKAAQGYRKLMLLQVPAQDIEVLARYNCMAVPDEAADMLRGLKRVDIGQLGAGYIFGADGLKDPLGDVLSVEDLKVPTAYAKSQTRPDTDLCKAWYEQLMRLRRAGMDHDARLMKRADTYMLGRPLESAKDRVLSAAMETYSELNWEDDFLPYITLNKRKI